MTFLFFSGWRPSQECTEPAGGTLQSLCTRFLADFMGWVEMFPAQARSADEVTPELDRLQASWSSALRAIEGLTPQTCPEAMAKLEVAQTYAGWSSPGEGRAADLLEAACAALRPFLVSGGGLPRSSRTAHQRSALASSNRRPRPVEHAPFAKEGGSIRPS